MDVATPDDDGLDATGDPDVALVVQPPEVAGEEPAIGFEGLFIESRRIPRSRVGSTG
jgi:hypothetical protein